MWYLPQKQHGKKVFVQKSVPLPSCHFSLESGVSLHALNTYIITADHCSNRKYVMQITAVRQLQRR